MAEVNLALPNGGNGQPGADGDDALNYGGTSTTSLLIATGSKVFTTQANLAYTVGARIRASSAGATSNFMEGVITAYSSTTLTVLVDKTGGSGTLTDWSFNIAGQPGSNGDTGSAGAGYYATSTSSVSIGTGTKTFTTQAGLAYIANLRVRVANSATAYMEGTVTSYSSTTLVISVDRIVGTGTLAVWTIGIAGDIASYTDTGWLEVSGFSHMPSIDRPQYRVLNKQVYFRGVAVIPLSTDTGATTTGLVLQAYTGEADYAAATGKVVPFQGSGGVTVNNAGAIYFNVNTAAISSSYYPNTTYVKDVVGIRRVASSAANREMDYRGYFTLSISSGGVLALSTLKDAEEFTGTDHGHSPLRSITSNVTTGDYVTLDNSSNSIGAVSQGTNITTGVTLNRRKGVITTQSASAAAGESHTFTVTDSTGDANAYLLVSVINYSGTISTNGIPVVTVDNRGSGTFNVVISNGHLTNALSGTLVIAYELINTQNTITHMVTLDAAEPLQIGGFMIRLDGLTGFIN